MGDFSLLEMKALGSHISVFIICDSPQKVKHCTESLQSLFSWHLLYLFGELYVIMILRSNSAHFIGKEVGTMNHIFAFMTSVAANVVSNFVCKWLDGWFKDRKH